MYLIRLVRAMHFLKHFSMTQKAPVNDYYIESTELANKTRTAPRLID